MRHRPSRSAPTVSRRTLLARLAGAGGLAALGVAPGLSSLASGRSAASAGSYRAIVCVFMLGGNDGNNLVVPTDATGYANYHAARGGALGTSQNGALALPPAGQSGGVLPLAGTSLGLHPSMPEVAALWGTGNVALVLNVGTLVRPFANVAAFLANHDPTVVPLNLYSHSDQQQQMQSTSLGLAGTSGWGGRLADALGSATTGIPVGVSVAGNALLVSGRATAPVVLPQTGALAYAGFDPSAASQARLAALGSLFAAGGDARLVAAAGAEQANAVATANALGAVLAPSAAAKLSGYFPNYARSGLSQQLTQVALMIEAATNGTIEAPAEQVFFVETHGFDTHNNQLAVQGPLLADLSSALAGFHHAMVGLGQANNVVAFTLSDFARTLKPASGGGTDHAWGSHHLVVGGAGAVVRGAYGTMPTLVLGGPSDVSGEGRWLPTTALDQYAATLAAWLGASPAALASAFPNLGNFAAPTLGFLA